MTYQERYVSAFDGLKLYVRDYKSYDHSKRTVLCLSGLTRNSQDFDFLADWFHQRGHRVITMDYRGRGKSAYDVDWQNYRPQIYVNDVFHVASALGLHECIFVGTSLGGLLTMAMATVLPTLVHSAILNDIGPELNPDAIGNIINYAGDNTGYHSVDDVMTHMKVKFSDEMPFTTEEWHRHIQKTFKLENGMYKPNWDTKLADVFKQPQPQTDLWAFFKSLGARKTLVLRGELSKLFAKDTYKKMLDILPNITGIEVPNIGHAPRLTEDVSITAISDFLERK